MSTKLFRNWWLLLIKALASVLIGILILFNPHDMAGTLMILLGLLLGLSGLALIAGGFTHRVFNSEWTWWLLEGLVDVLICLLLVFKPVESANFLAIVAGLWLCLMGFIHLATSINMQYYLSGNNAFIITAILLILSGLFFLVFPGVGLKLIMIILGIAILCYGILQAYLSLILKKVSVEEIDEIEDLY